MTKSKLAESQKYAKKNDLTIFNYLLYPRTKGFVATVEALREDVDAVYDITIAYTDVDKVSLLKLTEGNTKQVISMYIKRHPIKSLPTGSTELNQWVIEQWKEKEKLMEYFTTNKKFPGEPLKEPKEWKSLNLI